MVIKYGGDSASEDLNQKCRIVLPFFQQRTGIESRVFTTAAFLLILTNLLPNLSQIRIYFSFLLTVQKDQRVRTVIHTSDVLCHIQLLL